MTMKLASRYDRDFLLINYLKLFSIHDDHSFWTELQYRKIILEIQSHVLPQKWRILARRKVRSTRKKIILIFEAKVNAIPRNRSNYIPILKKRVTHSATPRTGLCNAYTTTAYSTELVKKKTLIPYRKTIFKIQSHVLPQKWRILLRSQQGGKK